ncbi:MAG TPA: N-acetyl-1-D-myo-inositol-2-amino-2-deoxy-alpha-D-glucopyranoside deacetylase [Marmoricola sp.]|nr:N-acetyl-1-D-myo-inositol-2-amino-2-deoxy-alpha-D-glucopyranoside deacetylase [Marmoricola sp.]
MDNEHRLLLVHAHPDDESINNGATMARYAAAGARVTLVTCTRGEFGEILVPELARLAWDREDRLGEHRALELRDAMKQLGVEDHRFLGEPGEYHDSGMAGTEGNDRPDAFWRADVDAAAARLAAVIREVRPQVLVTYNEFGGYGHPDHIKAHRVATYAASLAAVPSYRTDLGEAHDIAKIYWGAMSASRMREGLRRLREAGDTESFEGMDPDNLPPFVTEDENLSAAVDGTDYYDAKMAALRAHATQITADSPFFVMSEGSENDFWGKEFFRIAKGARSAPFDGDGLESDLFNGL